MEIVLTPDEARRGGRMDIILPARILCPTCAGQGSAGFYACSRCMGSGVLFRDVPVAVEFPPGITDGSQRAISLRHLGIRDVYVSVVFRIGGTSGIEDL
jgi:molecular chaperone DnaJ